MTQPTQIIDPNRGFRVWAMEEIYRVGGTGQYVPNVNDMVHDWASGTWRVTNVDYTTGISVLTKWNEPTAPTGVGDLLLGGGPGYTTEVYRVFLDQSVTPHVLALNSQLHLKGSSCTHYKVFLGDDISEATGQVISMHYDNSGNFLGENIPLELVVPQSGTNLAVKAPAVGYTNVSLPDGEIVTAVFYDDVGNVRSVAHMPILNTAFTRKSDDGIRYIVAIRVESNFLSPGDNKVIEYPVNMPVQNLNLIGVVRYSDGSTMRYPIDGTKFTLHGLETFAATIEGQTAPLVLSYRLAANEYSYGVASTESGTIVEPYWARTAEADGIYSVKLFAYPEWVDMATGYRLRYFLYNLNRDAVREVTDKVSVAVNSQAFNPMLFGTVQNLNVGVELSEVEPGWANYRHVQTLAVTLNTAGTNNNLDRWYVQYTAGQTPAYGNGVRGVCTRPGGLWQMDISCGCTTQQEWLDKLYGATQPLYDAQTELAPVVPDYVTIIVPGSTGSVSIPVSQWNQPIQLSGTPTNGKLAQLRFVKHMSNTDLQLAVAGLSLHVS